MVRIALAQMDPVLGEVDANLAHAHEQVRAAASRVPTS